MKKKAIIILLIIGFSIFVCLFFWIRYKELKELREKKAFQQVSDLLALVDTDFRECYIYNQLDKFIQEGGINNNGLSRFRVNDPNIFAKVLHKIIKNFYISIKPDVAVALEYKYKFIFKSDEMPLYLEFDKSIYNQQGIIGYKKSEKEGESGIIELNEIGADIILFLIEEELKIYKNKLLEKKI